MGKRTRVRQERAKKAATQRWLIIGIAAIAVVAVVGAIFLSQRSAQAAIDIERLNPNGMTVGAADAPVKVEEYADFQCPYCGQFVRNIEPGIVENYVNTGKAQFTFIPYSFIGRESVRAAEAAYCAADQNLFWEFHDIIFSNQAGENLGAFADNRLITFAQRAGLNMPDFRACFDTGAYSQQVQDDLSNGQARGVTGTPYFFVNGNGPINQNEIEAAIEQALASN